MLTKLSRKDLIDEISQLRQQVIELQAEIIRLRNVDVWKQFPVKPASAPVIQPEWEEWQYPFMSDDTTGDYLPIPRQPSLICDNIIAENKID